MIEGVLVRIVGYERVGGERVVRVGCCERVVCYEPNREAV